jgi:predicted RNase H-like HicB family nuclease
VRTKPKSPGTVTEGLELTSLEEGTAAEVTSRSGLSSKTACDIMGAGGVDMSVRTFSAVLHKEDDLYVAECPEVGTVSQGVTIEEAVANLKEATELYLEEFPLSDIGRPLLTTFEATYA